MTTSPSEGAGLFKTRLVVWAAALPKATSQRFPGAGHLLFEERPDAAAALVSFFRG